MKAILLGLLLLTHSIANAAISDSVIGAQNTRTQSSKNFILNPNGLKDTRNIVTVGSGSSISRNNSPASYDDAYVSISMGTTVGAGAKWLTDYKSELKGQNCALKGYYIYTGTTGSAAEFRLYDGTTILGTQILTPDTTSAWLPISIIFPCNSSTNITSHVINTAAGASSPTFKVRGLTYGASNDFGTQSIVTDEKTYSMSISATITAPTKGTIVTDLATWSQSADKVKVKYTYEQSSGGSNGAGLYLFSLPPGITIDTSKTKPTTNSNGSGGTRLGGAYVSNTPSNSADKQANAFVYAYDSTRLAVTLLGYSAFSQSAPYGSTVVGMNGPIYISFDAEFVGLNLSSRQSVINQNALWDSTGDIIPSSLGSCGDGKIPADGRAVSRAAYPRLNALYAKDGYLYGAGDGSTTFNVPNYGNVFLRGANASARTIGTVTYPAVTLGATVNDKFQGHWHSDTSTAAPITGPRRFGVAAGSGDSAYSLNNDKSTAIAGYVQDGTNGTPRTGSETAPVYTGANFCIVANGVMGMGVGTNSVSTNEINKVVQTGTVTCGSASTIDDSDWGWITGVSNISTGNCTVTTKTVNGRAPSQIFITEVKNVVTLTKLNAYPVSSTSFIVGCTNSSTGSACAGPNQVMVMAVYK